MKKAQSSKLKAQSPYNGLQENIRRVKMPKIEVWENKYPDREYTIFLEFPEFTCLCPKTGLPDFANIRLQYIPAKYCLELKSFKLYLIAFRNLGIFHEHVVNKVLDDFVSAAKPRWANIIGEFNERGGIKTTVSRSYRKNPKSKIQNPK